MGGRGGGDVMRGRGGGGQAGHGARGVGHLVALCVFYQDVFASYRDGSERQEVIET